MFYERTPRTLPQQVFWPLQQVDRARRTHLTGQNSPIDTVVVISNVLCLEELLSSLACARVLHRYVEGVHRICM